MEHGASSPCLFCRIACVRVAPFHYIVTTRNHHVTFLKVLTLDTPDRVRELPEEGCASTIRMVSAQLAASLLQDRTYMGSSSRAGSKHLSPSFQGSSSLDCVSCELEVEPSRGKVRGHRA